MELPKVLYYFSLFEGHIMIISRDMVFICSNYEISACIK